MRLCDYDHLHLSDMCPSVLLANRLRETGCPLGQFPCGNMSECLPQVLQCNGHQDCPNGADEQHCGESIHSNPEDTEPFSSVMPGKAHCSHVNLLSYLLRGLLKLCDSVEGSEMKPAFVQCWYFSLFTYLKKCGTTVKVFTSTHKQTHKQICMHTQTHARID